MPVNAKKMNNYEGGSIKNGGLPVTWSGVLSNFQVTSLESVIWKYEESQG